MNVTFKEPVHRIMDRIKNEPYFQWPNKMGGDPSRRNQNLYCTYHRDKGYTTEQCRVLKDHLEQLVKVGYLNYDKVFYSLFKVKIAKLCLSSLLCHFINI